MAALIRYRLARGLPEKPSKIEKDIPVVASNSGKKFVSDTYVNLQLKDLLNEAADLLEQKFSNLLTVDGQSEWAEKLRSATAHWLRHTLVTHNKEAGVLLEVTADQVRHRSLDTTRRIYEHDKSKVQSEELNKLEILTASDSKTTN